MYTPTPTNLSEELISLRKRNAFLEQTVKNLVEKNNALGEFIRQKLADILGIAKDFRDEYSQYAEFVNQMTVTQAEQFTGEIDESQGKELPVQLGDTEL